MKRILLSIITVVCALTVNAQTFTGTSTQARNPHSSGGTFGPSDITGAPFGVTGSGTLTFYFQGDLSSGSVEWYDLFDENGNNLTRSTLGVGDCNGWHSKTITVTRTQILNWATDGTIRFTYSAPSAVNGSLCGYAAHAYVTLSYPYTPPPHDGALTGLTTTSGSYVQIPLSQAQAMSFEATARNVGDTTITGVTANLSITPQNYVDSFVVDTMLRQTDTTVQFPTPFVPLSASDYECTAVVSIDQNDTVAINDTTFYSFTVSDTVLALDDSSVTGGAGFNVGTGEFGHKFRLVASDTLTSVSFYLDAPGQGVSLKAYIYESDTSASGITSFPYGSSGMYWNRIDSSRTLTITNTTGSWYSVLIGCEDGLVLDAGKDYMVGIYQLNPTNMSLGYTYGVETDSNETYYRNVVDSSWIDLKTSPSNIADGRWLLRPNFGRLAVRDLFSDTAYYCNNSSVYLKAGGNWETLSWGSGSAQDSIQVSTQGVYSLTVTDESSCSYSDSVQVLERDPIQFSANVTDATCGGSDGQIFGTASGTLAPYSYNWDNGMMGDSISGLVGGEYEVTITDAYGCERTQTTLVLGKNPVISGSYTPPTCNGDADGAAMVTVDEGIPQYTYSWQGGGSTTDMLGSLSSGSYSVTVTDSSNCSATITISVVDPDTLFVNTNSSSNPSNCGANDGEAVATATGGLSPYSYFWSNGQNQKNNINLSTGTYDVTVTDSLGCVRTASVTLIDPNAPTVAGNGSTVTCSEDLGSVSVTVTGGTAPFQYSWNNGSQDSSQTGLPVGNYSVNVVDAAGCIKVAQASVDGPESMDVDFQVTYGPAGDGDTDIDAVITGANTPYANYQWRTISGLTVADIAGATTTTLNDAVNGNYRIVVEDAQGCLDSADVEIENLSVGIVQNTVGSSLKVFPNPTNGKVSISATELTGENVEITVMDATGRVVGSNVINNYQGENLEVDLTNQAEGIYMIQLISGEKTALSKVQLVR